MGREHDSRRIFLVGAGAAGAGALLVACAAAAAPPGKAPAQKAEEEVSPVEDLMREHGVLRRVMLLYGEIGRRIDHREGFPSEVLGSAARIVRRFVEDYHEKLEEDFVFPRFEKARRLVDLVAVLRRQHQAGRLVTDEIQALVKQASPESTARLAGPLAAFVRMYGPHAAREDTVLFPELRPLLGAREYDALGDAFEDQEHKLFGPRGFEGVVEEVAQLEEALGIHDLASFTPR